MQLKYNYERLFICQVKFQKCRRTDFRFLEPGVLTGGQGFEPRLNGPEPFVLPLDDPPENQKSK